MKKNINGIVAGLIAAIALAVMIGSSFYIPGGTTANIYYGIDAGALVPLPPDGGYIAANGSVAFTGAQSFGDQNVTNVGTVALDTIYPDGTTLGIGDTDSEVITIKGQPTFGSAGLASNWIATFNGSGATNTLTHNITSGLLTYDGALTVSGAATASSTLAVTGVTSLNGAAALGDAYADAISVKGQATFGVSGLGSNYVATFNGSGATSTLTHAYDTGVLTYSDDFVCVALTTSGATTLGDAYADAISVKGAATFGAAGLGQDYIATFNGSSATDTLTHHFDGAGELQYSGPIIADGLITASGGAHVDGALTADGTFAVTTPLTLDYLLGSSGAFDVGSVAEDIIYTVPAGKTAIITRIVVRSCSASLNQDTDPVWQIGCNAGTHNDVVASATYTQPSGAATYKILSPIATEASTCAAASELSVNVTVAATGSTTCIFDAFGYLF